MRNFKNNLEASVFYLERFNTRLVAVLFVATGLLLGSYVYVLASSVWHVVLREDLEEKIAAAHSSLSVLETTYLEKAKAVTEDEARARGLTPTAEKLFVAKKSLSGATLTLRNEI